MTDTEFLTVGDAVLRRIEDAADGSDDDVEASRSGSMLTLAFDNGSQIVVNLQPPLHEVWVAAKAGGYHFRLVEGRWTDSREGHELFGLLSDCARAQADASLDFDDS